MIIPNLLLKTIQQTDWLNMSQKKNRLSHHMDAQTKTFENSKFLQIPSIDATKITKLSDGF